MTWKENIEYFYSLGLFDDSDVANFVKNGQITADDYKEITKKEYEK